MSRRRKHLTQQELVPPTETQQIVRAKLSRGSNIFEVGTSVEWNSACMHALVLPSDCPIFTQAETADGRDLLCFLPAKFNKKLWIKRGGFVVVEEGDAGAEDKVTATIVKVLYEQDVKALKKMDGVWYAANLCLCAAFLGTCLAKPCRSCCHIAPMAIALRWLLATQSGLLCFHGSHVMQASCF